MRKEPEFGTYSFGRRIMHSFFVLSGLSSQICGGPPASVRKWTIHDLQKTLQRVFISESELSGGKVFGSTEMNSKGSAASEKLFNVTTTSAGVKHLKR